MKKCACGVRTLSLQTDDHGLNSNEGSPSSSAGESSVRDPERTDTQVQNVVKILGLRFGTKYTAENIKTLRYGHLMIMTDQDHDGCCVGVPRCCGAFTPLTRVVF